MQRVPLVTFSLVAAMVGGFSYGFSEEARPENDHRLSDILHELAAAKSDQPRLLVIDNVPTHVTREAAPSRPGLDCVRLILREVRIDAAGKTDFVDSPAQRPVLCRVAADLR